MRVVSGEKRGLKLCEVPLDAPCRPTTDKVKEAMFDIIRYRLEGKALDLFSGTGQLGIEAVSNGCTEAVLCDNSQESLDIIKKNVKRAGYEDRTRILLTDYRRFIKTGAKKEEFSVIFLDPPYASGLMAKALTAIDEFGILAPKGVILAETSAETFLPETVGSLILEKRYRYGTIAVHLYSYGREDED